MDQEYKEERFMLEAEGMLLPAALALPESGDVRWGIVIIPGSMSSDVDGNYPGTPTNPHMYADLAQQLARRGHAVLRYAKAGDGTGSVKVDEEKVNAHSFFARQQYIAMEACKKIREMVPQMRGLAVAGHSEGAVHGLVLAQRPELGMDAYISLSGPGHRYMDLFIETARQMSVKQGEIIDFGAFKVNAANYIRTFELMREGKPLTDEIKADPTMKFFTDNWDSDSPQGRQAREYMLEYDSIDPRAEIAKIPCPMLIVQGGQDQSGVRVENGDLLYQARHATHPDATAMAFFPELQHFYKRAEPGMNSMESMALDGETDERVSDSISDWLDSLGR